METIDEVKIFTLVDTRTGREVFSTRDRKLINRKQAERNSDWFLTLCGV
jgi:hypothetical protein|tara:strand:+ start:1947 stop:2093 length:147 start_codon:yes stop_codon:yes gene_type:complete